jgi:uncharacterized protein
MLARVARHSGWILVAIVLIILGFVVWSIVTKWQETTTIRLGKAIISATVADSDAEREKGLGDKGKIGLNDGMLFVYKREARWGIWMKDMKFPIDIIWLDNTQHVVHITKNVSPHTFPETFKPDKDALYVLEVPAGTVDQTEIQIGHHADFDLTKR